MECYFWHMFTNMIIGIKFLSNVVKRFDYTNDENPGKGALDLAILFMTI